LDPKPGFFIHHRVPHNTKTCRAWLGSHFFHEKKKNHQFGQRPHRGLFQPPHPPVPTPPLAQTFLGCFCGAKVPLVFFKHEGSQVFPSTRLDCSKDGLFPPPRGEHPSFLGKKNPQTKKTPNPQKRVGGVWVPTLFFFRVPNGWFGGKNPNRLSPQGPPSEPWSFVCKPPKC